MVDATVGVAVVVDVGRAVVADEGLRSHGFGGEACMLKEIEEERKAGKRRSK